MSILSYVLKFINTNYSPFAISVEEQREFMNHLPYPNNLFQRSKNQYKCQMKSFGLFMSLAFNAVSIIVAPIHLFLMALGSIGIANDKKMQKVDAVYLKDLPLSYLPKSLTKEFKSIIQADPNGHRYFGKKEFSFLLELVANGCSPYLVYKTMLVATRYAYIKHQFSPECIIVSNEFSFTSSCLTQYCNENSILHYNVMHGEKVYNFRDSFFCYTKCFVWSKEYIALFKKLHAQEGQFLVEIPPCMKIEIGSIDECIYDCTYYLQNESDEQIRIIKNKLEYLHNLGWKIAVRPHPRYSNMAVVSEILNCFEIEDNRNTSIEMSIRRTKNVISRYSTVLLQAALNGRDIIIDDITDNEQYKDLLKRECGCFSFKHKLLSDY